MTLLQLLFHPPGDTPTHPHTCWGCNGDSTGGEGGAESASGQHPQSTSEVAQPVEGSIPAQLVPGGEGSGVTVCDLESESSQTEAVRMEEPSSCS